MRAKVDEARSAAAAIRNGKYIHEEHEDALDALVLRVQRTAGESILKQVVAEVDAFNHGAC